MVYGQTLPYKKGLAALGTFLLWTLMAALGILCLLGVREMVLGLYVLSLPEVPSFGEFLLLAPQGYNQVYWRGVSISQWSTFLSVAILWIGIVIGGAEFLFRNYGQPKAWNFLRWAIGLELVVLILGILI